MFTRLTNYVKGTRAEMAHVKWPTKKQITNLTILVIGASLFVAAYLGVFDSIFAAILEKFVL